MSSSPSITTDPGTEGAQVSRPRPAAGPSRRQAQHKTLPTPLTAKSTPRMGWPANGMVEWLDQAALSCLPPAQFEVGSETPAEIDDAYSGLFIRPPKVPLRLTERP